MFFCLKTHLLCIWPSTFEYINYVIVRFSHFLKSTMLKSEFRGLAILMLFSLFINKYCSLTFPFLTNEYLSHLSMNQEINFSSCQTVMHKIEKWTESLSLRVVAYFFLSFQLHYDHKAVKEIQNIYSAIFQDAEKEGYMWNFSVADLAQVFFQ